MRCGCRLLWVVPVVAGLHGCGGSTGGGGASSPTPSTPPATARRVQFVGFDVSPPLVTALKMGKIKGLVVQNPTAMGELGVRTLVDKLEGREVKAQVDTGETLVTAENLSDPKTAALVNPPKEDNVSAVSLSGGKTKKWRVIVIPKGTTHEHWKAVHYGAPST